MNVQYEYYLTPTLSDIKKLSFPVGIISLFAILGSFLAGKLHDRLGRKTLVLWTSPVMLLGWLTIALAPNVTFVLVGRAICGLSSAFMFSAVPVGSVIIFH